MQYNFSILRFIPDTSRGEVANIGIAVFAPDVDIRLMPDLTKVQALAPLFCVENIRQFPEQATLALNKLTPDLRKFALEGMFGAITIDAGDGYFLAETTLQYEWHMQQLFASYVLPEC